ncbi:cholecystokinin a [Ctenopharyngodon idella]|uniref:Preprocholecystokinin n=1 Tax=Ctenopharyngodon idella TaxID=7959 RepID=G3GHL9_CTEID|nr:cholecystokinin a [Ctenopharyngodon idella]AEI59278.1 preprocholecystokinin [Ctenopharyngodon idella]AFD62909.1 preprocholecystokinin [Ctenopharyngodon idella]
MNTGICVCVLLAALSTSSCISLHTQSEDGVQSDLGTIVEHTRHTRAAPSSGQLSLLSKQEDEEEPRSSLTELLARIISTKGTYRRSSSPNSRSMGSTHRIKDRDYLGWMDFGRRSAEEYEYSS